MKSFGAKLQRPAMLHAGLIMLLGTMLVVALLQLQPVKSDDNINTIFRGRNFSSAIIVKGFLDPKRCKKIESKLQPYQTGWGHYDLFPIEGNEPLPYTVPRGGEDDEWLIDELRDVADSMLHLFHNDVFLYPEIKEVIEKEVNGRKKKIKIPVDVVLDRFYARDFNDHSWQGAYMGNDVMQTSAALSQKHVSTPSRRLLKTRKLNKTNAALDVDVIHGFIQISDSSKSTGGQIVIDQGNGQAIPYTVNNLEQGDAVFVRGGLHFTRIQPMKSGRKVFLLPTARRKEKVQPKKRKKKGSKTKKGAKKKTKKKKKKKFNYKRRPLPSEDDEEDQEQGKEGMDDGKDKENEEETPDEERDLEEEEEEEEQQLPLHSICRDDDSDHSMISFEEIRASFGAMDTDGNSSLSKDELGRALRQNFGQQISNSVVDELYRLLGGDDASRLSLVPFDGTFTFTSRYEISHGGKRARDLCTQVSSPLAWAWNDYESLFAARPRHGVQKDKNDKSTFNSRKEKKCRDFYSDCQLRASNDGKYCSRGKGMRECPVTCNTCHLSCAAGDFDLSPFCDEYVAMGHCDNTDYNTKTFELCPNACNRCDESDPETQCTRSKPFMPHGRNSLGDMMTRAFDSFSHLQPTKKAWPGDGQSKHSYIIEYENFLPEFMVEELKSERVCQEPLWRGSQVVGGSKKYDDFRTSDTCFCNDQYCKEHTAVQYLSQQLSNVTGLLDRDVDVVDYSQIQFLRYSEEGFYKPHHDYLGVQSIYDPRVLTFFIYLNDVEDGGETAFIDLGVEVTPKAGKAVLWNNVVTDSPGREGLYLHPNSETQHEAKPVKSGTKQAINYWVTMFSSRYSGGYCERWGKGKNIPKYV